MRIGDIVAVDVGQGPSVMNFIGVVTRADSWNGIWVTSARGEDGDIAEQPLGQFVHGGKLVDRPDLEAAEPEPKPTERARPPLVTALFVLAGAVFTAFALRGLARRLA